MLHKQHIILLVLSISNIIVLVYKELLFTFIQLSFIVHLIPSITYVNKYGALKRDPILIDNLIKFLQLVVLCKINHRNNEIKEKEIKASIELLFVLLRYIVVVNEKLESRSQVVQETCANVSLSYSLDTNLSLPFFVFP